MTKIRKKQFFVILSRLHLLPSGVKYPGSMEHRAPENNFWVGRPQAPSLAQGISSAKKNRAMGVVVLLKMPPIFFSPVAHQILSQFFKRLEILPKIFRLWRAKYPQIFKDSKSLPKVFFACGRINTLLPSPKKKQLSQIFFSIENWENNFNPRWNFAN